ncbi:hypothetical protein CUR178_08094 [Leishmania enriettii]|uniref:Amastin-like surface protein-like protein n=1 Tax=Leishmania enriettii TaxID=5663 RepID=A0A836L143_LEIEN|nr:hypothetical protein CUR178_08094 [Leishmania enriettii]
MVSEDSKLAFMRGSVVLHAAAAALCLGTTAVLPIFRLNIEKLNSSITQSLWTTDIYTPAAEKHIPVKSFVKDCRDLVIAFQVAQAATLVGISALALAFLCAVFHISPAFTNSGFRVRTVCGAPICTLLLVAIIAAGTNCFIMHAMYENNWCENNAGYTAKADVPAVHVAAPAIMHLPSEQLREAPHVRRLFATRTVTKMAVPLDIGIVAAPAEMHTASSSGVLFEDCNPFDGCISSYREMGFTTATGWQATWAALTVAVVGFFAELTVMMIGVSRFSEAGVGESTIALLQGEDERLL